jgi:hypothetical protein
MLPAGGSSETNSNNSVTELPTQVLMAIPPLAPGVFYADLFTGVSGHRHRRVNGKVVIEGSFATRRLRSFADAAAQGDYAITLCEDPAQFGPDGQPGVLAASWDQIPQKCAYSGFVYVGYEVDNAGFAVPRLSQAKAAADLKGVVVRMDVKGLNTVTSMPREISFNLRMEIDGLNPYDNRCDLGVYTVGGDWEAIEIDLRDGNNLDLFVAAVTAQQATQFKLLWSQAGIISRYTPGDTLLIDNLEIREAAQKP